jgi:uncharacterized protein DUF4333
MRTLLSSSKSSTRSPVRTKRRPSGSRWNRCSSVAAVLIAASLALIACGSSGSTTILNTEKIERAIERSSLAQRGKVAQVSCPSGVHQEKDLVFSCTAAVGPSNTRFVVTQLDGSGHVHYEAR